MVREEDDEKGVRHDRTSRSASLRTCVGCGEKGENDDMVRLVLVPSGDAHSVAPDAKGGGFGRGAHVHPSRECFEKACQRGLSRAFKCEVRADAQAVMRDVSIAYTRRLEGLLSGGVRGRHIAIGTDAVAEAALGSRMHVVVLAADATAAAERTVVKRATAEGKTLVFGDKQILARALGKVRPGEERAGVGVCAVTDAALAASIRRAWMCAVGLVPRRQTRLPEDE